MRFRNTVLAGLLLAMVTLAAATPSLAGQVMAYKEKLGAGPNYLYVAAGACTWKNVAPIKITVPEKGYVIVTASGSAYFNSDAILTLSLGAMNTYQRGDWLFSLTPGPAPFLNYQSFSPRIAFPVAAAGTYTFYLRGRSCAPSEPGRITVQTGSITAEFYAAADVQPPASLQAPAPAAVPQVQEGIGASGSRQQAEGYTN
jgi:hypothetical protein